MAKSASAPLVVSVSTPAGESFGEWLAGKAGDSIESTGIFAGEIAGASSAAVDAFSATRRVSREVRVKGVRERAIARAAARGITLNFD